MNIKKCQRYSYILYEGEKKNIDNIRQWKKSFYHERDTD